MVVSAWRARAVVRRAVRVGLILVAVWWTRWRRRPRGRAAGPPRVLVLAVVLVPRAAGTGRAGVRRCLAALGGGR